MFLVVLESRDVGWLKGKVCRPVSQTVCHPIHNTKAWFEPRAAYVGFVVDNMSLGMTFPVSLGFSFLIIMPQTIYNYCLVNLGR